MREISPRQLRVGSAVAVMLMLALATPGPVAAPRTAAPRPYERIVVFGTSLSDSGNAFALLGSTNTPPDYVVDPFLVPTTPYRSHHFSNGATWAEQFARLHGLAGSTRPALRSSSDGATNYAVGAARAYNDGRNFNLPNQVSAFLQDFDGVAPPGALIAIEMGGNDIRDALAAFSQGQDGGAILQAAVASIAQQVARLYAAGATNFLIWSAPDVRLTPAIRALDAITPGVGAFAQQLTIAFNLALTGALAPLATLPGIEIARLDAFALITAIAANPSAFGLTNVTTACITPGVPPFTCQNADEFLFWDGIHPTSAVHAIVAQEAASVLANP